MDLGILGKFNAVNLPGDGLDSLKVASLVVLDDHWVPSKVLLEEHWVPSLSGGGGFAFLFSTDEGGVGFQLEL